jgi:Carboxypeptidase regulatory-like domain
MKSERWRSLGPLALALCLLVCLRVAGQSVPGQEKARTKEQISARLPAISGHVYRADTGAPLPRAVVTLYPPWAIGIGRYPRTETETDGSYRFDDVRPNSYTVVAACEGFVKETYSRDTR